MKTGSDLNAGAYCTKGDIGCSSFDNGLINNLC